MLIFWSALWKHNKVYAEPSSRDRLLLEQEPLYALASLATYPLKDFIRVVIAGTV